MGGGPLLIKSITVKPIPTITISNITSCSPSSCAYIDVVWMVTLGEVGLSLQVHCLYSLPISQDIPFGGVVRTSGYAISLVVDLSRHSHYITSSLSGS